LSQLGDELRFRRGACGQSARGWFAEKRISDLLPAVADLPLVDEMAAIHG
jgi:hypothetical protein